MHKIWLKINDYKFLSLKNSGLRSLNTKNINTSPWINNIVKKYNFTLKRKELPIVLVKIKVKELGFKGPTKLRSIYIKAKKKGYKLVPPEIAIYSRLIFKKQKKGEWIRFATPLRSMIDTDGVPHLPKLGKALGTFFLETYWSYPKAIFHPKNEFIFRIK